MVLLRSYTELYLNEGQLCSNSSTVCVFDFPIAMCLYQLEPNLLFNTVELHLLGLCSVTTVDRSIIKMTSIWSQAAVIFSLPSTLSDR